MMQSTFQYLKPFRHYWRLWWTDRQTYVQTFC